MELGQGMASEGETVAWLASVLSLSRSSLYRSPSSRKRRGQRVDSKPRNALDKSEKDRIIAVLNSDEYIEDSPYQVVSKLLDRGEWLCSVRTMYRILKERNQSRDRRNQRRHPSFQKPVLVAHQPNKVWSWDITRLPGPYKGNYFYLYVMLDIYSRYVVGWMVSDKENAELAQHFIRETLRKWKLEKSGLTIHSDRGSPMTAADTVELIGLLGLSQSLARPRTSDDNAFSEAQFKTLKYHRFFKAWYESTEDASECLEKFFGWYNTEHRHINLGLMTPETVHYGRDKAVAKKRAEVLKLAFEAYPERFSKSGPRLPVPADSVGINVPVVRKSVPVLG